MCSGAAQWDERYRQAKQEGAGEPTSLLKEWLRLLPKGRALDVACGSGRNTIYLARHGFEVTGIDWSEAALEIVAQRAREAKVPVIHADAPLAKRNQAGGVELFCGDLEKLELPERAYRVIVCVQYLQRTLFARMTRALQRGGVLLFETFTRAQLKYANGPRNPAYLLEPGELRKAFPELRVLFYRELDAGQGIASLVAQKVR